ncbi:hypothetical protein GCM10011352_31890 [Marinobacterium zhoushanense]|uniref:Uncharacterized protein n=1 Tax=Marinobacterium zhoushanense TaxID=1679163 RepID=A0ABQ1KL58_9GAMM|nr:hypothetical protein [Marinobacterium zhoushanense]GGC03294.1 hypothetical protein GCM10011352_31890 [Marinobacterium zhoushanense]
MEVIYIIGFLMVVGVISYILDYFKMKNLAIDRGEANICEYARSFDFRNVDTKIMREVWNELQNFLGQYNGKPFPLKANDLFDKTYNMDPDDLDDIYWSVADRLGIDTENPETNPYFNKVTSVKNLVLFLHHQPRSNNA